MLLTILYLVFFATAFAITLFVIARIIPKMKRRGLIGIDMNKIDKPKIPEMGGIAVLFGFWSAIMLTLFFHSYTNFLTGLDLTTLLAAFSTIATIAFIGVVDDLLGWKSGIKQWQKTLLPIVAAFPIMVLPETIGSPTMNIPLLGDVNFGILYPIIIVPIAVTGASNAVNMLAGFNGLEAGLGSIIATTLIAITALKIDPTGRYEALIILVAILGALLAFLCYNKYPAKIFPGDSLTLMIGASFAAVAIIANLEKIAVLLYGLYFVELVIKAKHRFKSECFGTPQKNGILKPNPNGGSLTHLVMRLKPMKEYEVVNTILLLQVILSVFVFILFYFQLF